MHLTPEEIEQVKGQLLAVAPNIASTENIDTLIDAVSVRVSKNFFGDMWSLALAYLVAHTQIIANRGGDGGAISSKKEGDLQVSYGSNGNAGSSFSSTSYGLEYEQLLKQCSPSMVLTSNFVGCFK